MCMHLCSMTTEVQRSLRGATNFPLKSNFKRKVKCLYFKLKAVERADKASKEAATREMGVDTKQIGMVHDTLFLDRTRRTQTFTGGHAIYSHDDTHFLLETMLGIR